MTETAPAVTIGVIARAHIPELDALADRLLALEGPSREVVIGVETPGATEPAETTDERGVRWIALPPRRGLGYNRNRVLDAARGDVLLSTDDDCVPSDTWMCDLLGVLEDSGVSAAVGGVRIPSVGFVGDSISALGFPAGGNEGFDAMFQVEADGTTENITTCNCAIRTATLRTIGGFDESFTYGGEDTELGHRLTESGRRIVFSPTASVTHPARRDLSSFGRWFFVRGRAKAQYIRRVNGSSRLVSHRLASYGRIVGKHLTDPKIVLIVPLIVASMAIQWFGFAVEWVAPSGPRRG